MDSITGGRVIARLTGLPVKNFDMNCSPTGTILGELSLPLAYGAADEQIEEIWHDEGTLAGAATVDIDLQSLTDVFGDTIVLTKCKGFLVKNISEDGGAPFAEIAVGGAAANEFIDWVGAVGDKVNVHEDGGLLVIAPNTGYTVGAAAKNLRITNVDGAKAAKYQIVIVGIS